jgi:hypothetical protein
MARDSTPPLPGARQHPQVMAPQDQTDATLWRDEFRNFVHGRVTHMQTSAQSWLGVMTTLLGLFSAVVVLSGGTTISQLPVGRLGRGLVFALAVIAFGLAFTAVVIGARATFGGLGLGLRPKPPFTGWLGKLPKRLQAKAATWWTFWSPLSLAAHPDFTWETYRNRQLRQADELRRYLHRSRILGIAAAFLAAVLALVVLGIGAFAQPSRAPTSVVVIESGQVTCGSIDVAADGQTYVGGRVISRATQVVVVAHC